MENKQEILNKLLPALQATRNLSNLDSLKYVNDNNDEIVIATFKNGGEKTVNVTADSGTAMITDLIKRLV